MAHLAQSAMIGAGEAALWQERREEVESAAGDYKTLRELEEHHGRMTVAYLLGDGTCRRDARLARRHAALAARAGELLAVWAAEVRARRAAE